MDSTGMGMFFGGAAAALALEESGLTVHLATKLRLGDSNTIMAEC